MPVPLRKPPFLFLERGIYITYLVTLNFGSLTEVCKHSGNTVRLGNLNNKSRRTTPVIACVLEQTGLAFVVVLFRLSLKFEQYSSSLVTLEPFRR